MELMLIKVFSHDRPYTQDIDLHKYIFYMYLPMFVNIGKLFSVNLYRYGPSHLPVCFVLQLII